MEYDDIIVGGGSAGAVLAARLSEEPARRVLLLEAGPDYATLESTPADLQDGWRMSLRAHDWGLTAEAVPGRAIPYPRGRVIGGSSAVNATIALRGVPADYDEWAALGNDEWSWAKVLPHFRRLEDDPEGAAELHGRGGPIAIRRWRPDELIPVQRAFFEVCRRLGFPEVTDHNHPEATGVGPFPQNRRDRLRLSTAIAYLLPARHRPNLTIRPHCLVNRVLFAGDRAVGVDIGAGGEPEQVRGRRITLAAGAIGSPAILLRSGIGPKAALAELGHRAGGRSSRRRRGPGRPSGHPAAAGAQAGQLRPGDPARAGGPALHRSRLRRVQRHAAGHVQPRRRGRHRRPAGGGSGGHAARDRAARRARTPARARPPAACEHRPARPAADPAQLRRPPGGPAPARRRRPPRLADRAPARDRPPHAPRRPAIRGNDGLGRRACGIRPRDRLDPVPSLRHGPDGPGRAIRWQWSTSIAGSAPSRTCAWSMRRSCRPSRGPTSTSPAS